MDRPAAYRVSTLRAAGFSRLDMMGAPWSRTLHGVRMPDHLDLSEPDVRIAQALALLTPGAVLTGWAGARMHGVRVLDGMNAGGTFQPVVIANPGRGQLRVREGLSPTRRALHEHEITSVTDQPVATLARCAYDLALDAPSLWHAVVGLDMCVSTVMNQATTSLRNIRAVVDSHRKTRGIVTVRRALELASERSASPLESSTRLVAATMAGYTELLENVPIFDPEGHLVGVADLLDPSSGVVIETDGHQHRDLGTHTRDNTREEALERAGLFVARVTALDHRDRPALAARLAAARWHARSAARAHRWTTDKPAWWVDWTPGRRWD